ncbi:MAG: DUF2059 domain-containing protein [Rhizobiales bacterium]|nr:DUF2059 domain-containing protein [Hyphomicrobiales bacterium]
MMRAAALAAFVAGGVSGVHAQQRPAAPAPAAPAAPAAEISPAHLAAARQLATRLRMDEPIVIILDEMRAQVIATFTTTRPEIKKDLESVLLAMNPQIAARREEILNTGARDLAVRFSQSEIGELLTFFNTPLGGKYLTLQPQAFTEYSTQVQQWISGLNDFVVTTVRAEMKKKGHDL